MNTDYLLLLLLLWYFYAIQDRDAEKLICFCRVALKILNRVFYPANEHCDRNKKKKGKKCIILVRLLGAH